MAGLLSDIYSAGDTLKRRLRGLLADPAGTIGLGVERFGEDQQGLLNLMSNAHPMAGDKTVLNNPKQVAQFRGQLADKGTEQAMAGMFVGQGSKTWDAISAKKAEQMAAQGVDPRKVWSETGTWKGPDGAWRQEIPDNAMKMEHLHELNAKDRASAVSRRQQLMDEVKAQGGKPTEAQKFRMNSINNENISDSFRGKISDALQHDSLYKAYPSQANEKFNWMEMPVGTKGEYSPESGIALNMGIFGKDAESFTAHEMQHAIQQREGFARGGSPEMFADTIPYESLVKRSSTQQDAYIRAKASGGVDPETGLSLGGLKQSIDDLSGQIQTWKSPHDKYLHLAGEAEARATQARIPLDAAQRRALFPEDSYDVPIDQLIIRGLLGK